jgi:hypothetical protein
MSTPATDENRREFLQAGLAATAAAALANVATGEDATAKGLPTRPLGKTGVNVSIICLGGWHIGCRPGRGDQDQAHRPR